MEYSSYIRSAPVDEEVKAELRRRRWETVLPT